MPAGLARLGVLWARHAAAGHINLYATNVPGPPFPLYLAGADLRDVAPLAPLVAGVRLSVTALSYAGTLSVALLGDEALGDFPAFAAGVRSAFNTYRSQRRRDATPRWPEGRGTRRENHPPQGMTGEPPRRPTAFSFLMSPDLHRGDEAMPFRFCYLMNDERHCLAVAAVIATIRLTAETLDSRRSTQSDRQVPNDMAWATAA